MDTLLKASTAPTRIAGVICVLAIAAVACPVDAGQPGYATDSSGVIARNNYGECVRTFAWRPDLGVAECGDGIEVAEAAASEAAPETETRSVTLDAEALFDFDKATLRPDARSALDELARRMTENNTVSKVGITGHADRIGTDDYNQRLSEDRARAAATYLQENTRLRESQFEVQGVGESQPVVECEGERVTAQLIDCLQPNRRVVIDVSLQENATSQ